MNQPDWTDLASDARLVTYIDQNAHLVVMCIERERFRITFAGLDWKSVELVEHDVCYHSPKHMVLCITQRLGVGVTLSPDVTARIRAVCLHANQMFYGRK